MTGDGERERLAPESSRPRSGRSGRIPAEPYPPLRSGVSLLPAVSACQGEGENLRPLALQGSDGAQLGQGNGDAVAQGEMAAEEVVVGDEEDGESEGAVAGGEAAGRADVVFVGSIEAFDELLEGAKFLGDGVAIFQTDDLAQGVRWLGRSAVGVKEVEAGLISGVAVGDEAQGLRVRHGAGGLAEGHGGGQGIALGGEVVGSNLMTLGIEK